MNHLAHTPSTTVAVLLGAQDWPRFPSLAASPSFRTSAQAVESYLHDHLGLSIPSSNIATYFDDVRSPIEILEEIKRFLRSHPKATDLVLYYVGHGAPVGSANDYRLLIRFSDSTTPDGTTLAMAHLAEALRQSAPSMRWYVIIDACFAARSVYALQAPRGVSVLCAVNQAGLAMAPQGAQMTMFTGSLVEVLREGEPHNSAPRLSMRKVCHMTASRIVATWGGAAVRPEVHSPDQRQGDLADYCFFPNPAARTGSPQFALDSMSEGLAPNGSRGSQTETVGGNEILAAPGNVGDSRRTSQWANVGVLLVLLAAVAITMWLGGLLVDMVREVIPLPAVGGAGLLAVLLCPVLILVNHFSIRRAQEAGRRRQQEAVAELKCRLLARLDDPPLCTPDSVRSLAKAISERMSCPYMTDTLIIEAIRAAALELEDQLEGQKLVRRLETLNLLLRQIDAEAVPLLSVRH